MSTSQATQELDIDAQLAAMEEDLPQTQPDALEATQPSTDDLEDQIKALEEAVDVENDQINTENAVQEASQPVSTQEPALEAAPAPAPSPTKQTKAAAPAAAKKPLIVKKKQALAPAAAASKPSIVRKKLNVRTVPVEPTETDAADADGNPDTAAAAPAPETKAAGKLPANLAAPKPKSVVAPKTVNKLAKPAAKAAVPAKKTAADEAGPSAAVIKRPSSAYMFFQTATRPQVKADNEGITFGELGKRLGEMWKEMSEEDKAPFVAQAEEDKARYEKEVEANGGVKPVSKSKKKAGAGKAARVKTAYELFCQERHPELKKSNPKAGKPEIDALAKAEWADLDKEGKQPYVNQNKALKLEAAQGADNDNDDGEEEEGATAANAGKKRGSAASKTVNRKNVKRAKKSAGEDGDEQEDGNGSGSGGGSRSRPRGGDQDDEDEIDRENVDWEAHPAVAILSKTRNGKYVVARRGLPLYEFGEVSASAAAQRRSGLAAADAPECPVPPEMLDEFESFNRTFKREIFDSTDDGELDLDPDHLQSGTLLESCAYLGALRQPDYDLSALDKKNDTWMKVPLLALCRNVQRMIDVKQKEALTKIEELTARCMAAEAELKCFKTETAGDEAEA